MAHQPNLVSVVKRDTARFKGIAGSSRLNRFMEDTVNDVNELYRVLSLNLVSIRRVEDIIASNMASLQEEVRSLALSSAFSPFSIPMNSSIWNSGGVDYAVAEVPKAFQGVSDFSLTVEVRAHVRIPSEEEIGGTSYAVIDPVSPVFQDSLLGLLLSYWNEATGEWIDMSPVSDESSIGADFSSFFYDTGAGKLVMSHEHYIVNRNIRLRSVNPIFWTEVGNIQEIQEVSYFWYNISGNIFVFHPDLAGINAVVNVVPRVSTSRLNAPASEVVIDFFSAPNVWTSASAALSGMSSNVRYRVVTDPAKCNHDQVTGQITLPVLQQEDKLIIRSIEEPLVPDSLKATARVFQIHREPTDASGPDPRYYYNPGRNDNPFDLEFMLNRVSEWKRNEASSPGSSTFSNPEIPVEEIPAYFDQTDPLYAVDGRNDTPAWLLSQYNDLNIVRPSIENGVEVSSGVSHIIVFFDIEIPEDLRSTLLMNAIQVHPLPVFKTHLIDVRYKVGEPFGEDEVGKSFHMLRGVQGTSDQFPNQGVFPDTVLGKGSNIFYNAPYLEFHVKKTECNHIRLAFAFDYDPVNANRRNIVAGATHIGVYLNRYKEMGSFRLEFDTSTGFNMDTLGDTAEAWVNNKYALFNPDPDTDPQLASVRSISDNKVEVSFGIRRDDLRQEIELFDNSATPSFNRVILR